MMKGLGLSSIQFWKFRLSSTYRGGTESNSYRLGLASLIRNEARVRLGLDNWKLGLNSVLGSVPNLLTITTWTFWKILLHCNDVHLGQVRSSRRKEECHFCKMGREAPRVCIHFVRKKGSEYPKSFMHDKTATMTLNLHLFFNLNTISLTFQILQ